MYVKTLFRVANGGHARGFMYAETLFRVANEGLSRGFMYLETLLRVALYKEAREAREVVMKYYKIKLSSHATGECADKLQGALKEGLCKKINFYDIPTKHEENQINPKNTWTKMAIRLILLDVIVLLDC